MINRINRIKYKLSQRGFNLRPSISDTELKVFEDQYNIKLPLEYRMYLTEIGNGGNGPPDYGLVEFGKFPDYQKDLNYNYRNIGLNFPFSKGWIWEDGIESNEGGKTDLSNGNIYLGTSGCGMDWYLIINGIDRGIPWFICGEGAQPICPKRDFLQWYEDWLDGKDSFYGYAYDK